DGRDAFGYVTPATMDIHDYQVSAPQLNLQQGEVNEDGAWMGGGVGETLTGIWEDPSQGFHDWGFNTDCADSPYYILKGGSDFWNNGGYG
ncbi:MAG TPA: hypothetical protein VFB34_08315, partial [Chloroflexota bacterium]|nr:hypothetical protein [Chloroflexota bacterium]